MKPLTFWQRLGMGVRDPFFLVGSLLVVLLVLLAVLGPDLAPHNPFLVQPIQWIDGELFKAPFAPSRIYPLGTDDLGRDQLSLLLYGARTTLVMAFIAMVLRMLLGLLMGTFAGWRPGGFVDRAVTILAEFMASIPGLILAVLLVYAIGIRRGQVAFIVALALVGCGEVAQIMRGHVMSIRHEQYIEAARAVGLSSPQILSRHVLPNLMGTLLALAALEMGSVLLLLGELAFVNVFIGGGRIGYSESAGEAHHYFDIPDWGAMLGTSWRWFRSYPWFPIAPAAAFFIAVFGFNLFGHGLQRFIERGRFHPSGWSVLRFLALVALILVGARALILETGLEAQFADMAREFGVGRAMEDVSALSGPEMQDQQADAAEYIAAQFAAAGLSPASPEGNFALPYTAARGRVTAPPALEVLNASGQAQLDLSDGISFDPWQAFQWQGSQEGPLFIIANTTSPRHKGILLLLNPDQSLRRSWNSRASFAAIVRLVPDDQLHSRYQAPEFDMSSYGSIERLPDFPNLLIGESAARRLLAQAGLDLEELQAQEEAGERLDLNTGLPIRISSGLIYEETEGLNVVGYIAGLDTERRGERILVAATYGHGYPGADENASGVAVMLEMARTLQQMGFTPKRTIVFAALDDGGGYRFVSAPPLPTTRSEVWTTLILSGVGVGGSKLARVETSPGLARTFDQSAHQFGVRTEGLDQWPFFVMTSSSRLAWSAPKVHTSYQALAVTRPGDERSGTPADTPDRMTAEQLAEAGQVATHFVMLASFR